MRRILIDQRIEKVALKFKEEMDTFKKGRIRALEKLKKDIVNGKVRYESGALVPRGITTKFGDYLSKLIEDYRNDRLVLMLPNRFEETHEEYKKKLSDDELSTKVSFDGRKTRKPFWEWIFDTMGYKRYVRELAYPRISKELGIKACVYCNANYTITDKNNKGYYELDHWMPKSKYPFLSMSFYNLQPCCPHCNKRKSDDTEGKYMRLYEENETMKDNLDVFAFSIPRGGLVRYFTALDTSHINVVFKAKDMVLKKLSDTADEKFGITGIYNEHKDIVEEMMWRAKFYDNAILRTMTWFLDRRWSMVDVARFKLGTYADIDEIHKRPLTKFMQDIGKELEII